MNYDQVVAKIEKIEEKLDLLFMVISTDPSAEIRSELVHKLTYEKDRAAKRMELRFREGEAAAKHWELKQQMAELECEYPSLREKK